MNSRGKLIKLIGEFIFNVKHTVTAKEITNYINLILDTTYSVKFIRGFMKKKVNISYKKVKSRQISINMNKIKMIRNLFAVKFSQFILKDTLLINNDESSINRNTKLQYSWGFKGVPIESQNSLFVGSVSMLMAILSNGSWINFVINETINSANFSWFLKILYSWLKTKNFFGFSKVVIILDNCSIHKSNSTESLLSKINFTVFYILAYSPDFAPVEMSLVLSNADMLVIKNLKMLDECFGIIIKKIYGSLSVLKSENVKKMFVGFIKISINT